jgi:hypothetical protein
MDAGEYLRSVVRVFPDYADTVIWFAPGPVDYVDARVSDPLRHAMEAWEKSYYEGINPDFEWRSAELETAFNDEGATIACALSHELGDSFEVEFVSDTTGKKLLLRGSGPGTNPAAVQAFREMAADDKRTDDYLTSLGKQGLHVGLSAADGSTTGFEDWMDRRADGT